MNVALKDCHDHLREAFAELRLEESRWDAEAGRLEAERSREALRARGRAAGLRQSTERIGGILGLMERYLALSEKWEGTP